ncbi:MAG TPA: hypothetical protein VF691_20070 [Cytophagaceae bacterium]|jgi:hypothetical protein
MGSKKGELGFPLLRLDADGLKADRGGGKHRGTKYCLNWAENIKIKVYNEDFFLWCYFCAKLAENEPSSLGSYNRYF